MNKLIKNALEKLSDKFAKIDEIALNNQAKVLRAFSQNKVALRHFSGTSGYGYDDAGRDTLSNLVASIFNAESAIASPLLASGTHAITVALFGLLRQNDVMLSITGEVYDTLQEVVLGKDVNSLADIGVKYEVISLLNDSFDSDKILNYISTSVPRIIYIQRSRGYEMRSAISNDKIKDIVNKVRKVAPNIIVMVDNCYGEFVEELEPTDVGADIVVGSFIKNFGGGLAPSGGYIAGKNELIKRISYRLTSSGIGQEVGSYAYGYKDFYQGIFLAPHVVAQAVKITQLFSYVLSNLGYEVLPSPNQINYDIVCSIKFNNKDKLISFCQAIQRISPIDSFVTPMPWAMPGYADQVIMSAGCFIQGASIELSCDAPIKPPYVVYMQGGLTLEHGILALEEVLKTL
ncbi:MAG: methionine gamma-lyase family protein [Clostridia bacterium]